MNKVIVNYRKPEKVKTKVLSIRLSEKLLSEFDQFKEEFKELTGCEFNTRLMVSTEIKKIVRSFKENKK